MEILELALPDTYMVRPQQHPDKRGVFMEWFRQDKFSEETGLKFEPKQCNFSESRTGVMRGLHYSANPGGHAKIITCTQGRVMYVILDTRVGAPTFGHWVSVVLDDMQRQSIYVPPGRACGFYAYTFSTVSYLMDEPFDPKRDYSVNMLDPTLKIRWPQDTNRIISDRDLSAPTLAHAKDFGLLPKFNPTVPGEGLL